jgi:hypothetical protein
LSVGIELAHEQLALADAVLGVRSALRARQTVKRGKQRVEIRLGAGFAFDPCIAAHGLSSAGPVAAPARNGEVLGGRVPTAAARQQMLGREVRRPELAPAPYAPRSIPGDELRQHAHICNVSLAVLPPVLQYRPYD